MIDMFGHPLPDRYPEVAKLPNYGTYVSAFPPGSPARFRSVWKAYVPDALRASP